MTFRFDHAVIAVHNLDQAVADYRAMGFTTIYGGEHAAGTTHNALICFQDGSYLELLAPTNKPPRPGVNASNFSDLLESGEGLVGYALLSEKLVEDAAAMRERGVLISDAKPGGRLRMDGVELRWESAIIGTSMSPFFIRDVTARNLRVPDDAATAHHANGVTGVNEVIFVVSDLDTAVQQYQKLIGIQGDASENATSFDLGQAQLTLTAPADEDARQHIVLRGDAPYILKVTSDQPLSFDMNRAHGVRFQAISA